MDYEVQRCTRRCCVSSRELREGEAYYSALLPAGGTVERRDYSAESWSGPPEGALGWWKAQVPTPQAKKARLAPSDVLLEYFNDLAERPAEQDTRYVLALLLVRRRVLRMEEGTDDGDRLTLYCPREDATYRVPVAMPDEARAAEIQERLARLLYAEAA